MFGQCKHSRPKGGGATGPNPTNRAKPGTKRHLVVDRAGAPLATCLSAANRDDSTVFEALIDAIPAIKRARGRPLQRPTKLHADRVPDIPRPRHQDPDRA